MYFSTIFTAAAAASLAVAAPVSHKAAATDDTPGKFEVTDFRFDCTTDQVCKWSLKVANSFNSPEHPAVKVPVKISGNLAKNQDYVVVKVNTAGTRKLKAYIEKGSNILKLGYDVQEINQQGTGESRSYLGEKKVYPSPNPETNLQSSDFTVDETRATSIA